MEHIPASVLWYLRLLESDDDVDTIGQARERAFSSGVRMREQFSYDEALYLARNPALDVTFFYELMRRYFWRFPQEQDSILAIWQNHGDYFGPNERVQEVLRAYTFLGQDPRTGILCYMSLAWPVPWPEPDTYELAKELVAQMDIPQVDPYMVAAQIPGLGVAE